MTLAVINCSQVVTLAGPARPRVGTEMGQLGIVASGALLVKGQRIARIGSTDEILALVDQDESGAAECEVVDAGGRVVLPGFVDAHTHPVFAGTRVDEFEEAGVDLLLLQCSPQLEEMERFAETVIQARGKLPQPLANQAKHAAGGVGYEY